MRPQLIAGATGGALIINLPDMPLTFTLYVPATSLDVLKVSFKTVEK